MRRHALPAVLLAVLCACESNPPSGRIGDLLPDPGGLPDAQDQEETVADDADRDGTEEAAADGEEAGDPAGDPAGDEATGEDPFPDPAGDAPTSEGTGDASEDALDDAEADAGTPATIDPSARGRFQTQLTPGNVARGDRTIPVVAHGPRRIDGLTSPLVVFLPGFQAPSDLYQQSVDYLASHGFVVVRAEPPGGLLSISHVEMAKDVIAVIDWAVDPLGPLTGRVDETWIGVAGHSLGGKLATMAAYADPRVKALFAIDPVNGGAPILGYTGALPDIVPDQVAPLAIPMGFPGETWSADHVALGQSCAPADQNYTTFYDAATSAPWKAKWEFPGADHMDFVDDLTACGSLCDVCPDGTGRPMDQVTAMRTLMAAFFLRHHDGLAGMEDWLFGAKTPDEAIPTHAP